MRRFFRSFYIFFTPFLNHINQANTIQILYLYTSNFFTLSSFYSSPIIHERRQDSARRNTRQAKKKKEKRVENQNIPPTSKDSHHSDLLKVSGAYTSRIPTHRIAIRLTNVVDPAQSSIYIASTDRCLERIEAHQNTVLPLQRYRQYHRRRRRGRMRVRTKSRRRRRSEGSPTATLRRHPSLGEFTRLRDLNLQHFERAFMTRSHRSIFFHRNARPRRSRKRRKGR
jgi:hypothetical protein